MEQVLQQVIAVLLLTPLLDGPQDVLEVLGDPRSLFTQSSGSAVDTTSRLQDVALKNDIDHARELVLRGELAGLQGTDRLGNLDTLRFGREFGLNLGPRRELLTNSGREERLGFGHCGGRLFGMWGSVGVVV